MQWDSGIGLCNVFIFVPASDHSTFPPPPPNSAPPLDVLYRSCLRPEAPLLMIHRKPTSEMSPTLLWVLTAVCCFFAVRGSVSRFSSAQKRPLISARLPGGDNAGMVGSLGVRSDPSPPSPSLRPLLFPTPVPHDPRPPFVSLCYCRQQKTRV